MNSESVTVVNLQKLKYTPMMNGITNPMMNAANVGSAKSAHHFRIALPAMLIIACLLSFLLHSAYRVNAGGNSIPQRNHPQHCFLFLQCLHQS